MTYIEHVLKDQNMNWRFRTSFFGKLILQVERGPNEWEDATTVDLKHYYEDQARLADYLR